MHLLDRIVFLALTGLFAATIPAQVSADERTVEFCLTGEFDLGARYQGLRPAPGEYVTASWCVISEDHSPRVQFRSDGKFNPDMGGTHVASYLPPDVVRIVRRNSPPDLQFQPATIAAEALRYRQLDPRRLLQQLEQNPDWIENESGNGAYSVMYPGAQRLTNVLIKDSRLHSVQTIVDFPLRGAVPVHWNWRWVADDNPSTVMTIDGQVVFRASGAWRELGPAEATATWAPSGDIDPRSIPGQEWPSRVAMRMETYAEGVYIVHGVRTGFSHLVIDTTDGLVIADAPAGWVELTQVPATDLVPGLGISGLSERFIDFLAEALPGRPISAVALTHVHDDHAGGARAFAAAGARIYAPAELSEFLETALQSNAMPADRYSASGKPLEVLPVAGDLLLPDTHNPVRLMSLGAGPHADASLGVFAVNAGVFFQSDLHVPGSDAEIPRAERAATECWFAKWATTHLQPATVVINSHSGVQTPVSRLAKYLDSGLCRS